MAHAIPKIQYRIYSYTGNLTSGSPTITGLADTSTVYAGQTAKGTGIQAGSKVLSKTSSTVTLDKNATATSPLTSFELYDELEFEYPPVEDGGESIDPKSRESVSMNGTVQTLIEYFEGNRDFRFRHISQAIYESFRTFAQTWACFGKPFRYFDDKTTTDFIVYELSKLSFRPKKIAPKGTGYVWEFPVSVRRVLDSTLQEVTSMQSFSVVRPSTYPHTVVKNTLILVDTSTPRSLQLPEPAAGLTFRVKDAVGTASANNISLLRFASEKIETVAATKLLQTNFGAWELTSDGVDWFISSF